MGQQNSPVPSPYTPQSPATGYIQQYPHHQPPSYNQHQQIQQGERVCCIFMFMREETEVFTEMLIAAFLPFVIMCMIYSSCMIQSRL